MANFSWKNGKVDMEGKIETRGTGADFLANLRSEGTFQARGVSLAPDSTFRAASGSYEFWLSPLGPKVRLTSLQAASGNEKFSGQGETLLDGKLQLDLTSATRVVRMSGTMVPLKLDITDSIHASR